MTARSPQAIIRSGVYGVLGHEIGYTLSPSIFRSVFDDLGWPAVYGVFDRGAGELRAFLQSAPKVGIVGLNVTKPHKVRVASLLNRLDETAQLTGAVNTIAYERGSSTGYNTDLAGVHTALKPHAAQLRGKSALILGTGGAARAVAVVLDREFGMRQLTFATRQRSAGTRLLEDFGKRASPSATLEAIPFEATPIRQNLGRAALLVNATPVGTAGSRSVGPLPRGLALTRDLIVFDLVYRPRQTRLLKQAAAAGCRTIDGWGMLLAQAEESFRIWTGRGFPVSSRRMLRGMT